MVAQLSYKFVINSVDVTDYVLEGTKIRLTRDGSNGNSAEIIIRRDVSSILTLRSAQSVAISRGTALDPTNSTATYKFRGEIKRIEKNDDSTLKLTCRDPLQRLKYLYFTESYDINVDPEAGEYSAIFKDIAEQGGFIVSTEDSGTGAGDITAEKFVSYNSTRSERMQKIASILDWFFYYDYDQEWIRFEPRGFVSYPTPLVVGTNVYNIPTWDEDIESMRNVIKLEGAYEEDTRIETATGDGTTTEFQLTFTPEATELTVDGVLQVRGVPGSTTSYDYVVDKDLKRYTFVTAPTMSADISMSYTTRIPTPVIVESEDSIEYHNGLRQEERLKLNDIQTVDDAETRALELLSLLEYGDIKTTLDTDEYEIKPGMLVPVEDPERPELSNTYVVQEVLINYPDPFDQISIGTDFVDIENILESISDRIDAIEQEDTQLAQILRQIIALYQEESAKLRDATIQNYTTGGVGFYLDHHTYGVGYLNYFGDLNPTIENTYIVPGNNTYVENFVDNDYIDTARSSDYTELALDLTENPS
jgi:hypothetical protein